MAIAAISQAISGDSGSNGTFRAWTSGMMMAAMASHAGAHHISFFMVRISIMSGKSLGRYGPRVY
jgi:hypothetical protein